MKGRKGTTLGRRMTGRLISVGSVMIFACFLFMLIFGFIPMLRQSLKRIQNTNAQAIALMNAHLDSIEDFTQTVVNSEKLRGSISEYFKSDQQIMKEERLRLCLHELSNNNASVCSIALELDQEKNVNSIVGFDNVSEEVLSSQWYQEIRSLPYASRYYNIYLSAGKISHYVSAYSKTLYIDQHLVTITIFFLVDEIVEAIEEISRDVVDNYVWVSSTDYVFFSKYQDEWASELEHDPAIIQNITGAGKINRRGYQYLGVSEVSNWKLISRISMGTFIGLIANYILPVLGLFILFMFSISIVILRTVKRYLRPLNILRDTMNEISGGNLDRSVEIHTGDELEELSVYFNKMLQKLKWQINQLLEKEKLESEMRYSLLISQIDPHFICNTINTTSILARRDGNTDIVKINMALIEIMRDQLRIAEFNLMDTVEQEISTAQKYFIIQTYRYGNRFQVEWQVEKGLYQKQIPKSIIQILLENSLLHGLVCEDGNARGRIEVSIKRKCNIMELSVYDTGKGMTHEKIEEVLAYVPNRSERTRGKHVGLYNVRERLRYMYGEEQRLSIESEAGKWTRVIIVLNL